MPLAAVPEFIIWIERDKFQDTDFWVHLDEPQWDYDAEQWESSRARPVEKHELALFGIPIPKPGECVPYRVKLKRNTKMNILLAKEKFDDGTTP
jgi:hypothetical protein